MIPEKIMFSSIAIQKKFQRPWHWKPVLEVNGKNYGFISAFLNAGLHEEYWENPK